MVLRGRRSPADLTRKDHPVAEAVRLSRPRIGESLSQPSPEATAATARSATPVRWTGQARCASLDPLHTVSRRFSGGVAALERSDNVVSRSATLSLCSSAATQSAFPPTLSHSLFPPNAPIQTSPLVAASSRVGIFPGYTGGRWPECRLHPGSGPGHGSDLIPKTKALRCRRVACHRSGSNLHPSRQLGHGGNERLIDACP